MDPSYQRSIENGGSQALIRAIARDWDWALCQPLVVAQRPGDGLFVVDGQHRLAAARLRRDIYDLPCVIIGQSGPAEEAAAFVALNRKRKSLGALDLFKAALAGGDEEACAVMVLVERAGLTLAPHTNQRSWKPGAIANIGGIQRFYRAHGGRVTGRALCILARAFAGAVLRYGGTLFAGLAPLLVELGARDDDELLVMLLAGMEQEEWFREIAAVEARDGIHRNRAALQVLRAAWAEATDEDEEVPA